MHVRNTTPLSHILFERRGKADEPLGVLVLQGRYRFDQGDQLALAPEQSPVLLTDVYRGDPRSSSLRVAGAIATYKRRTDITFDAVAHAPESAPTGQWPVSVRVGPVEKHLLARGPSAWVHAPVTGWSRTRPVRTTRVPVVYERAFGGRWELDGRVVAETRNPVGTGYLPTGIPTDDAVPAPQILSFGEPEHRPGARYAPAGLGPIPSHFDPRPTYLGTTDGDWEQNRFPLPPADFDDAFYQTAHPDLIAPGHLVGDEPIVLVNVRPKGEVIRSRLPGVTAWVLIETGGQPIIAQAELDALHIDVASEDPAAHAALVTFRLTFPLSLEPSTLQVRLVPLSRPEPQLHA